MSPVAQFPSRMAALLIDMVIQITLLAAVVIAIVVGSGHLDEADGGRHPGGRLRRRSWSATRRSFETLTRGKTLGKMAIGLRVVSDDGGAERFRQALVRALTGAIEIWTIVGAPDRARSCPWCRPGGSGSATCSRAPTSSRSGPRAAPGCRPRSPSSRRRCSAGPRWPQISRLSDQNAEAASSYLRRLYELRPAASDDLGLRHRHGGRSPRSARRPRPARRPPPTWPPSWPSAATASSPAWPASSPPRHRAPRHRPPAPGRARPAPRQPPAPGRSRPAPAGAPARPIHPERPQLPAGQPGRHARSGRPDQPARDQPAHGGFAPPA